MTPRGNPVEGGRDDGGPELELPNHLMIRAIREIVGAAGDQAISRGELEKAVDVITDIYTSAGLFKLWSDGDVSFAWDVDAADLVITMVVDPDTGLPRRSIQL